MTVAFFAHDSSLRHEMPAGHPEHAERIGAILAHLDPTGLADDVHHPERVDRAIVERVHTSDHLALLDELDRSGGGRIDLDTSMGGDSLEAAERAAGAAVEASGGVLDGVWDAAFVCMRPPGHHATQRQAMGFCLINHVAVAARWALDRGLQRIAIVDWDAHHGNGTQDIFYDDPAVLYTSVHQYPWYPGTGDVTERGNGAGLGTTINVPLPAGAGEDAYERALIEVIEPAVAAFDPQLVLVSAGYDAHRADPLCMMDLGAGAFFRFAQRVRAWGPGPVCVLEGGYDLDALAWSAAATLSALHGLDEPEGVPTAELGAVPGAPQAHRYVDRAVDLLVDR